MSVAVGETAAHPEIARTRSVRSRAAGTGAGRLWSGCRDSGVLRSRHLADCLGNLKESVVQRCVLGNGFAVRGYCHQFAERCGVPVARTQDYGDDARFAPFMALHRPHHLDVIAIVGGEKVGADQEQNDVRDVELFVDLAVQILTGTDPAIMSGRDHALPEKPGEVLFELIAQGLVRVRVGPEDVGHDCST